MASYDSPFRRLANADSPRDWEIPANPPHFLNEDRFRPSVNDDSKTYQKPQSPISFSIDLPQGPSSNSSFIYSKTFDIGVVSHDEQPQKPPVRHENRPYTLELEDRPRSALSGNRQTSCHQSLQNFKKLPIQEMTRQLSRAVDLKTEERLSGRDQSMRSTMRSCRLSPSPITVRRNTQDFEAALQRATSRLSVKTIIAMQSWFKPNDAVCASGLGLIMLFCDLLPNSNYWEAVQLYFRKPGQVIQQVRMLPAQIKSGVVEEERFEILRRHVRSIDPRKLRHEDRSGNAELVYDFLKAAVDFYGEVNPTDDSRVISYSQPKKTSYILNKSSERTRETSPTFNELPEHSYLPKKYRLTSSYTDPEVTESVFASADPALIERFVEQQSRNVSKLAAERRRAEWDEVRDFKEHQAEAKRNQMLEDIKAYREASRTNSRHESAAKLSKVKERHEHNASTLEYKKLYRHKQEIEAKERSMDDKGRSLAKWSKVKVTPVGVQPEIELSPEEQTQVTSKIMELKLIHRQLQERATDERRSLSRLRGFYK